MHRMEEKQNLSEYLMKQADYKRQCRNSELRARINYGRELQARNQFIEETEKRIKRLREFRDL